jgi:hypothetical protein
MMASALWSPRMRRRPRSAERICERRRTRTPRSGRTCVGDRSCLLVAFLFVIQVHTRHQTVNCTVGRMHRSVGGPVTGRYRPIFAAVTGEARNAAGGPASIPPLSFRVCERRAVSPDRRTEFRGGTRDILLLELAHRYAGSLANGASVAVQSARPLATDGLPSPNTSVQPTCTPIAIRAAERAQSSGGARAGLGGSRRIETDPKGPRNRGLTLRMVYPVLSFYPLLLPGGAIEIREDFRSY